jgi:hypothetical protein
MMSNLRRSRDTVYVVWSLKNIRPIDSDNIEIHGVFDSREEAMIKAYEGSVRITVPKRHITETFLSSTRNEFDIGSRIC